MTIRNNPVYAKRNDKCPCGSGAKYKKCCSDDAARGTTAPGTRAVPYIDSGETAIRWVICNAKGTGFFSDKADKIIVFTDKAVAFAVAHLDDFATQEPGEINVAGVGAEKFAHLCETLPYVEVTELGQAIEMIRERIAVKAAELATPETPTEEKNDEVK